MQKYWGVEDVEIFSGISMTNNSDNLSVMLLFWGTKASNLLCYFWFYNFTCLSMRQKVQGSPLLVLLGVKVQFQKQMGPAYFCVTWFTYIRNQINGKLPPSIPHASRKNSCHISEMRGLHGKECCLLNYWFSSNCQICVQKFCETIHRDTLQTFMVSFLVLQFKLDLNEAKITKVHFWYCSG